MKFEFSHFIGQVRGIAAAWGAASRVLLRFIIASAKRKEEHAGRVRPQAAAISREGPTMNRPW